MDHQPAVLFLYFIDERISFSPARLFLRLQFPCLIRFQEAFMHHFFSTVSAFCGFLVIIKRSQIIDLLLKADVHCVFAVSFTVFLAAIVNYYFFAGQAVFIFIYWCFRMATGSYKMSILEFLRMAMEIIVGFLCAGAILVPSIFCNDFM